MLFYSLMGKNLEFLDILLCEHGYLVCLQIEIAFTVDLGVLLMTNIKISAATLTSNKEFGKF